MRKIFLAISLILTFAISGFAGGLVPIAGYAGCENGLYYPDTGECVLNRAVPDSVGKRDSVFFETSLIRIILSVRNIIF